MDTRQDSAAPDQVSDVRVHSGAASIADADIPPRLDCGLLTASSRQLLGKRVLDIVVALLALILLSPIVLVAACAIKLSSAGPVFYLQERAGRDGKPFRMFKFRSMCLDAERQRSAYLELNECAGPIFKIRHDPRVTPVGRVLRRWSIDELPQLLNVIHGEMSLVGPRPPLPEECEHYGPRGRQRLLVKPGITCIWQVSGRSDVEFAEQVRMDLDYIANWGLAMDIMLLVRTVPAVLERRGAY
ncbi:exopolysaccharide biosynthesis polyprenyl glycosylphosphotransferase [Streptomyces sp. ISL-96]|uniref:sugar transferase n=1 Tax=Streptomyces sp. ISL-96 TaxID=2819191 RepID=UPI001BE7357F|nr:sugar transferase [Streptomyces sp. ISL-96]MBT2489634.1 exopolysaccharide biosynthesis polyprenyl glycosylphosphotransferase [Streptomyces sp. ISL-96]